MILCLTLLALQTPAAPAARVDWAALLAATISCGTVSPRDGRERVHRQRPPVRRGAALLPRGRVSCGVLVRDEIDDPAAVRVEHATLRREDALKIDLRAGGGFVARI